MNKKYITDVDVNAVDEFLSVSDRTIIFPNISKHYKNTTIYLEFFDSDKETTVTPTTGTVKFYYAPIKDVYLTPDSGATINAADVNTTVPTTYSPVEINGLIENLQIVFESIDVATYVKIKYVQV